MEVRGFLSLPPGHRTGPGQNFGIDVLSLLFFWLPFLQRISDCKFNLSLSPGPDTLYEFRISFSISLKKKNVIWDVDRVCIESADQFIEYCHLNHINSSSPWLLDVFPLVYIFNFFQWCFVIFSIQVLHYFSKFILKCFILFDAVLRDSGLQNSCEVFDIRIRLIEYLIEWVVKYSFLFCRFFFLSCERSTLILLCEFRLSPF